MPNFNPREHINGISDDDAQVQSPPHYTVGGYEAIDILRSKLTHQEYQGYLKGNILKYMMRANYKGHHDQDCLKAQWYADELAKTLKHREVQHGTEIDKLGEVPF